MSNKYVVYKHTTPSEKVYIGITCKKPKYRWGATGCGYRKSPYFYSAVKKYGWDNIKHEILFENLTKEEACAKEKELIALYDSTNSIRGYNLSTGGESGGSGRIVSKKTREKMSKSGTGKHFKSEETRLKISEKTRLQMQDENLRKNLAVKISTRNKASHWYNNGVKEKFCACPPEGFILGRLPFTDDWKTRCGKPHFGVPKSKETKIKMSISNKGKNIGGCPKNVIKIICIETGVIYNSFKEATHKTGLSFPTLKSSIINNKVVGNNRYSKLKFSFKFLGK